MIVLACDPGTRESAILAYDNCARSLNTGVETPAVLSNETLLWHLRERPLHYGITPVALLIEAVESYGQRVGAEIFETVRWAGRFQEAWEGRGGHARTVPRRSVKAHLCGVQQAKDADIRQALLYLFGDGSRESAIGRKAKQGPLYGIGSHLWSALAIAVTWCDLNPGWPAVSGHDRGE